MGFMGYSEEAKNEGCTYARGEYRSCRTTFTATAASRVNISDPRKRLAHRILLVFDISAWCHVMSFTTIPFRPSYHAGMHEDDLMMLLLRVAADADNDNYTSVRHGWFSRWTTSLFFRSFETPFTAVLNRCMYGKSKEM